MSTTKYGQKVITFNGGVIDRLSPERAKPGYIDGLAASDTARTIFVPDAPSLLPGIFPPPLELLPPGEWQVNRSSIVLNDIQVDETQDFVRVDADYEASLSAIQRRLLEKFGADHVTVQIEHADRDKGGAADG